MSEQKPPDDSENSGETKRSRKPRKPDSEGDRPNRKPEGGEHQIHVEILKRRMRGGPEPTSDAYARALEQWKNLPGSIVRPPTDVTLPPKKEPSEPADQEDQGPTEPDQDDQNDQNDQGDEEEQQ